MFTLGYSFRPWTDAKAIADGPSILQLHPRDGARVRHRPQDPLRPPRRARRVVDGGRALDGRRPSAPTRGETVAADLRLPLRVHRLLPLRRGLHAGASRARERFAGQIVHPQHWPEDLDYDGKRVVVIGSGATAVTLVPGDGRARRARDDAPALAELRRLAARRGPARRARCGASCRRSVAYPIVRWKNVLLTTG